MAYQGTKPMAAPGLQLPPATAPVASSQLLAPSIYRPKPGHNQYCNYRLAKKLKVKEQMIE